MIAPPLGPYRILTAIGRGGMGQVFLASDDAGRRVALKVMDRGLAADPSHRRRFAQELEVLQRLDHPHVLRTLSGLLEDDERIGYATEYVRGPNLAQLLAEVGRLAPRRALGLVSQALDALAAAHGQGIVHRDIKSANLLLCPEAGLKLCDFGLARAVDMTRLTLSGQVMGTPAYISPEQAAGDEGGPASDLYSLGVVLFELLTGGLPFEAAQPVALLAMHLQQPPPAPSARGGPADPRLDALVLRALAKQPAGRFADAAEMRAAVDALSAALDEAPEALDASALETVVVRLADARTERLERALNEASPPSIGSGRRRVVAALIGIALATVVGVTWRRRPAEPPPRPVPSATVHLRDGQQLRGELVRIRDGRVELEIGGQRMVFQRTAVADIRFVRAGP